MVLARVFALLILLLSPGVCTNEPAVLSSTYESAGLLSVDIENRHDAPITGFLIETTVFHKQKKKATLYKYFDATVNVPNDHPIEKGARRTVHLLPSLSASPDAPFIVLTGVLFQDGKTFGTSSGIEYLIVRRRAISDVITAYRAELLNKRGCGLNEVVTSFQMAAQAARSGAEGATGTTRPARLSAVSQVTDWINTTLLRVPQDCGTDCVGRVLDHITSGLDFWQRNVAKGLTVEVGQ